MRVRRFLLIAALLAALGAFAAPAALAATINVSTTSDDLISNGNCTLREAIQAANDDSAVDNCTAGSGADIVNVPAGSYALSVSGAGNDNNNTGDLDFTGGTLDIVGASARTTAIDAAGLGDRVLDLPNAGTLTLSHLKLTGGLVNANGGGIRSEGSAALNLTGVAVTGNKATED